MAVIGVLTVACFALAESALQDMARLAVQGLSVSPNALESPGSAVLLAGQMVVMALKVLAPLLFGLVVMAVLVGLLQTRGVFSATPLKPDWSRLNPATGFKRFFSMRLLYEALKSTLKLAALALVATLAIQALLPGATKLLGLPGKALIHQLIQASGALVAKLCAVLAVFAVVDLTFARWDFMRNMRMSRREVDDELKNREGDPRIKSRLRDLRMQYLQRTRSVARVPTADVLITNPTHIAVALRYEHGRSPAPQLVAKGAGRLAKRMREMAYKSRVPIVQSPVLARALYKEMGNDSYVPEHWYPQVARILVWLQAARQHRATTGSRS